MTEAQIDYSKVNRNDSCPCGSGKKFKVCHAKIIELQKQTQAQQVSLRNFVRPGQYPFQWFKGLQMLNNRRDWALVHELFLEGSPLHGRYPTAESFVEEARTSLESAPASNDFEALRYHTVDEFAFILGVRGREDRHKRHLTYEVLALLNTNLGLRITQMERLQVEKGESDGAPPFERFTCFQDVYKIVHARPVRRPVVKHWDPATRTMVLRAGVKDTTGDVAADGSLLEVHTAPSADLAPEAPAVSLRKPSQA